MKLDNLNQWLALLANVGVLIGIIVVAVELRQTQTEMRAESNTTRTEMARENDLIGIEFGVPEIRRKLLNGEELTPLENDRAVAFYRNLFRHFENIHFQNQLGVLDEETWQSIDIAIRNLCDNNILYEYVYTDGFNPEYARASFRDFVNSSCIE